MPIELFEQTIYLLDNIIKLIVELVSFAPGNVEIAFPFAVHRVGQVVGFYNIDSSTAFLCPNTWDC